MKKNKQAQMERKAKIYNGWMNIKDEWILRINEY